jgi:hypothetical protein
LVLRFFFLIPAGGAAADVGLAGTATFVGGPGAALAGRGGDFVFIWMLLNLTVWIGCDDVQAVFDEIKSKGAIIHQPLTNYSWALELRVRDPDGHVLRFGSDAKRDQPFADAAK